MTEQAFCPRCEGHGRVYRPHNGPEHPALIGRFTEPGNYLLCPDCDGTGELTDGETEQAFWADVFARRDNAAMAAMAAVRALVQGWRWA